MTTLTLSRCYRGLTLTYPGDLLGTHGSRRPRLARGALGPLVTLLPAQTFPSQSTRGALLTRRALQQTINQMLQCDRQTQKTKCLYNLKTPYSKENLSWSRSWSKFTELAKNRSDHFQCKNGSCMGNRPKPVSVSSVLCMWLLSSLSI